MKGGGGVVGPKERGRVCCEVESFLEGLGGQESIIIFGSVSFGPHEMFWTEGTQKPFTYLFGQ